MLIEQIDTKLQTNYKIRVIHKTLIKGDYFFRAIPKFPSHIVIFTATWLLVFIFKNWITSHLTCYVRIVSLFGTFLKMQSGLQILT